MTTLRSEKFAVAASEQGRVSREPLADAFLTHNRFSRAARQLRAAVDDVLDQTDAGS